MNIEILKGLGFGEQVKRMGNKKCPCCYDDIKHTDFRDVVSVKEYCVSGLCMQCQDDMFGGEDEK